MLLRAMAGGMSAVNGAIIVAVILLVIAALQGLALMGGPVWTSDEWLIAIFFGALAAFMWGAGTLKLRPSMGRGLMAFLGFYAIINLAFMFIRGVFFGLDPWFPSSALFLGGFIATFAASWGMGAFRPGYNLVETAESAVEHDVLNTTPVVGAFDPIAVNRHALHFVRTRIVPIVRPLIGPLAIALGIAILVVAAIMVIGSLFPGQVQTDNTSASAITPTGYIAGMSIFGQPVSKLAFFVIIVVLVFGGIGTMALGLALLVNALSTQVLRAKKEPAHPLDYSQPEKVQGRFGKSMNFLIRLRTFFAEWVSDISRGLMHTISR